MNAKTILLVEDNPDDQRLTQRALNKNNIANTVVVAEDGAQALAYLFGTGEYADRDTSILPAVVLLDLNLPKIDGLTVLERIRADPRTRQLPVVILTSSIEEQDVSRSYQSGVNSYVRKPIDFVEFVAAARQLGIYWLALNHPPPPGGGGGL